MKIRKQTLFPIRPITSVRTIVLYDIKAFGRLIFISIDEAINFCKKFNELQCINDLENGDGYNIYMYIDTDDKNKKHRLLFIGYTDYITEVSSDRLIEMVRDNRVTNLKLSSSNKNKLEILWVIEQTPKGFKEEIETKYQKFIKTRKLLGEDYQFKYIIIGKNVIYTETRSRRVIIPNFITTVSMKEDECIEYIVLTDSVKFIGSNSISSNTKLIGGNKLKYIGNNNLGHEEVVLRV